MMTRFTKTQRLGLVAILLLAFALRLYRLGVESLWYDETVSALLASKPLASMWAHTAGDIHPPLYYGLLHLWTGLTSSSEFTLAFMSLWFGMATIPLITYLALQLYGPRTGVLAALLVAVNPFSIWYAQEVRMYSLGTFLLAIVLVLSLDFVQWKRRHAFQTLGLYVIIAASALWTLYYSAFALAVLNTFVIIWLLLRDRQRLWPWLLAQIGVLVLYLPWLPNALRQVLDPPVPPWRDAIPLHELLLKVGQQGSTALAFGQSLDPTVGWAPSLVALFLALAALRAPARRWGDEPTWWASGLLWVTVIGPVLLIFAVSALISPLYHVRYLSLYNAAYPVLVAVGLLHVAGMDDWAEISTRASAPRHWLRWRQAISVIIGFFLLVGTFISLRNYHTDRFAYESADDLRSAVRFIYDQMGPRDAILINAGYLYPALLTYWPGDIGWLGRLSDYPPPGSEIESGPIVVLTGHVGGDSDIGWGDADSDFYPISSKETADSLARLFADTNTVWQLRGYDTVNDPGHFIRSWLESSGELMLNSVFPGQTSVRVQVWRTTPTTRSQFTIGHSLPIDFESGMRLLGYDMSPPTLQAGEPLRLTLYWQRTGAINQPYKVFVQLLDEGQNVISQDDAHPGRGEHPTDQWLPGELVESTFILSAPADLSTGEYALVTGFYDETSGERLLIDGGGDAITLRSFFFEP
ncbi:MAG: hypothetical protein GY759_17360 [Chloroflexi bacterium]|nr:hypothetical protein [Chloroflexota bacterium]